MAGAMWKRSGSDEQQSAFAMRGPCLAERFERLGAHRVLRFAAVLSLPKGFHMIALASRKAEAARRLRPDACLSSNRAGRSLPHTSELLVVTKGLSEPTDSMKTIDRGRPMRESLKAELAKATAELKAHMASWEYAFAMAGGCHGGRDHPAHWETQARTERLTARCNELRARLAEHEL